ncbi:MAG: hypothetical protein EXS09_14805 [Gemmataceae bacterium]|nr:hypothetical protein [Gemmataceae bacterium]
MNLRCPVCRADNTAGPTCRRCKADLSLLIEAEACRSRHMALAQYALTSERFEEALEELAQAEGVRAGSDVQRMKACAYLLAGDFATALGMHSLAPG